MSDFTRLMVQIGADLDDFDREMARVTGTLDNIAGKISDVGGTLTAGLTVPLAGVGIAAINIASDVGKATGMIQAQLGLTKEEAEKLTNTAKDVWKQGFGESVDQVATDLAKVKQNMGDVKAPMDEVLKSAYTLQDAFGADISESSAAASVMIKQFGVDGQTAMDLITVGFQKGGDFSGELLDSLREYAPQFSSLGMSAEDAMNLLISGAQAGAFNLDKVGDAVKEFNIRAKDGSTSTAEGFKAIGLNASDMATKIAAGGPAAEQAYNATIIALAGIEDPIKRNTAGVALFGTQWEDLESKVITSMTTSTNHVEGFEGASQRASDALYNNFGDRLNSTLRTLQSALEPVGNILLNVADTILPPLVSGLQTAAEWFGNLDPAIQTVGVVIGIVAAAIGPLLLAFGAVVSTISTLTPLFAGISLTISGPVVLAIGALIAAGVLLYQNWDEISAYAKVVWGEIQDFIKPIVQQISSFITSKFGEVKTWWMATWPQLQQAFTNIWNGIVAFLKPTFNAIKAAFDALWPYVKTLVTTVWEGMKQVISGAINIIKGIIGAFASAFTGDWTGLWNNIKLILSGAWELIKGVFGTAIQGVLTILGGMATGIGAFFGSLANSMLEYGKNLIQGLWEGMASLEGWINAKVTELVESIGSTIKDFFGIASPSKLTTEYGGYIAEGLANGINDNAHLATSAAKSMADGVKAELTAAEQALQDFWLNVATGQITDPHTGTTPGSGSGGGGGYDGSADEKKKGWVWDDNADRWWDNNEGEWATDEPIFRDSDPTDNGGDGGNGDSDGDGMPDWLDTHDDSIPGLAKGGTVTRSGATLVGEEGPEVLDMPRGSRVTPLTGQDFKDNNDSFDYDKLGRVIAGLITPNMNVTISAKDVQEFVSITDFFKRFPQVARARG